MKNIKEFNMNETELIKLLEESNPIKSYRILRVYKRFIVHTSFTKDRDFYNNPYLVFSVQDNGKIEIISRYWKLPVLRTYGRNLKKFLKSLENLEILK
jgi:hypothetical protein